MKIKQILSVLLMLALVLSSVGMVFATEPTSADNTVIIDEDEEYRFSTDDFEFSDDDGDSDVFVKVKSLPTAVGSTFTYVGSPVAVDDLVYFNDIQNNYFRYAPAADEFGVGYDSFTFTVIDGAWEESVDTYTLTIDVNEVNNAPTADDSSITLDEDSNGNSYTFVNSDFEVNFADDESDTFNGIIIGSFPDEGSLEFNSVEVSVDEYISASDLTANRLTFFFDENENGVPYTEFDYYVVDSYGTQAEVANTMTININPVNDAPTLEIADQATNEDANIVFNIQAEDIDGDSLTYFLVETVSAPAGTSFKDTNHFTDNGDGTATIDWTPDQDDVGDLNLRVHVTDGQEAVQAEFTITVNEVNDAPFIVDPVSVAYQYEDSVVSMTQWIIVGDEEGDAITFTMEETGSDCISSSFGLATVTSVYDGNYDWYYAELSWDMPTNDDVGTHDITVTISDGNSQITEDVQIIVTNTNDAPTADSISTQTAWINALNGQGEELSYQVTVSDVDLDVPESTETFTYALTGTLPNWGANGGVDLSIDSNGLITGTPDANDAGASYNVEVTVTDSGAESDMTSFTLNVDSSYGPEMDVITTPQAATEDSLFTLDFSANDQDSFDSELVFTIVEDSFSASYGTTSTFETAASLTNNVDGTASLSWAPINDDVGTHTVTVIVTDANGVGMSDEVTFQISVANVNDAPEVEDVDNDEAYENTEFTVQFTVTDPESDSISVDSWDVDCNEDCDSSSLDLDLGDDLTQSGNTFTITWTPDNDDADTNDDEVEHDVEIVFTDGTDTVSLHFTITVGEELTGWEIDINDLETLYEEYNDDFDDFEDDLRDAEDDDDENDIEDAEDDLEKLDDDLKDLEDDLEQLEEDIEDDDTLSSSEEDDLLEWIDDILSDISDLRDDIDDLLKYGTDGSSTDGESASQSSSSSSSSSSSDDSGSDGAQVEVTTLNGPSSSSDSSESDDDKKTTWDELRGMVWLIAGIVIAFAVFIFLLAVLMTGGKKRAPSQ